VDNVIETNCCPVAAKSYPGAPSYALSVSNDDTDFWQDEDNSLITEDDLSMIELL
jgi:hypothetical protein